MLSIRQNFRHLPYIVATILPSRRAVLAGSLLTFVGLAAPAEAGVDRALFVVTRSKNANKVVYDIRLKQDGRLDLEDPVAVYWVMLAEDGRRESLTWLERRFAYGLTLRTRVRNQGFRLRLAAFDGQDVAIRPNENGRYRAYFTIGGQRAMLRRIHVDTDERGLTPSVRHVDLFGVVESTGKPVSERRRP